MTCTSKLPVRPDGQLFQWSADGDGACGRGYLYFCGMACFLIVNRNPRGGGRGGEEWGEREFANSDVISTLGHLILLANYFVILTQANIMDSEKGNTHLFPVPDVHPIHGKFV